MKVVITGASGLLGRQVVKAFKDWEVVGTAFSRAKDNLVKLDLTDKDAVETFFNKQQPNVVVHCAAERRPDVAEKDKDGVLLLNVESSKRLATIYYVFDGTSPPYEIGDKPNPLQFYGQTKLAGENAVRQVYPNAVILRVPILYGETEYNGESAVNVLIDVVLTPQKPVKMDNVAQRYPTNVADVAHVIKDLAVKKMVNKQDIRGIYHFTAQECMTKYQMCEIFAELLNVPIHHLTRQDTVDPAAAVSRPENAHLSVKSLESAGINTQCVKFAAWFGDYFSSFKPTKQL